MGKGKTLLEQIKEEAVAADSDLATLLRKCCVLASRLQNATLKKWAMCELNGYIKVKDIPDYRKFAAQSFGDFCGYAGRTLTNAPIPMLNVPAKYREGGLRFWFLESVAELQKLSVSDNNGKIYQNWSADLVAHLARSFYQDMNMLSAYKAVSVTSVIKILETVRNRILNFVLELENEFPNVGEKAGEPILDKVKVDNLVSKLILKDVANVSIGCGQVAQQATVNIEMGNWALLEGLLKGLKIAQDDIAELKAILKEEQPKSKTKFGDRLSLWLGGLTAKAAQGVYDISTGMVSGVIAAAICKYYGW
jgi:hypothetical protein